MTSILAAGLRGAGSAISEDEVAALAFDGGLNGAIAAAIALLEATFADPAGSPSPRPPLPPAS